MIAFHVRPLRVVVGHELGDEKVQMPLAKDNEFVQAFPTDRADEPLTSAVHSRRQLHPIATIHVELFG